MSSYKSALILCNALYNENYKLDYDEKDIKYKNDFLMLFDVIPTRFCTIRKIQMPFTID